ncbi:hypothetical protein [Natronorubrum daqingense]|uniref:Uncharacterized protein n=1 Tax=Natronorubrum daqingense TaxID=588898 RepID=A0A1N7G0D7_9EURY|nr:hypothetical protein [Natronorubrum daqingense]SIS05916.1 hypothetical protein SAMN05421809_3621 [Natronorubrum daqingense]
MPSTNVSTDLTTAAVGDGNELCPACEWPEGAQDVLDGCYVQAGKQQKGGDS